MNKSHETKKIIKKPGWFLQLYEKTGTIILTKMWGWPNIENYIPMEDPTKPNLPCIGVLHTMQHPPKRSLQVNAAWIRAWREKRGQVRKMT